MTFLSIYGAKERRENKQKIKALANKVNHYRLWKTIFIERFPELNTGEVYKLLGKASKGETDDKGLLQALEIFIAELEESRPDWYLKKLDK